MRELERLRNKDGLSREEYEELANIYVELGHMLDARNIVEEAYKLSISDAYIEKLDGMFVDIDEESEDIKDIFKTLGEFLKEGVKNGDFSKVIRLFESEEWNKLVMPFMRAGYRNYYAKENGSINMVVRDGYSESGEATKRLYYVEKTGDGSKGIVLERNADVISLYIEDAKATETINDLIAGESEKEFTRYTIDSIMGTIEQESGSLNKGLLVGDYSYNIIQKDLHSLYELYQCRNDEPKESYVGLFDENGKTKVQPLQASSSIASFAKSAGTETVVVYAYNTKKDKCLYRGASLEDAGKGVVFDALSWEYDRLPEIKEYTVSKKLTFADIRNENENLASDENLAKVRIYNGQIQVFNGETWSDCGAYEAYLENDPFYASAELVKNNMEEHKADDTVKTHQSASVMTGSITTVKQQVQVAGVNRPSNSQSSNANPAPAPAPAPTPAPSVAPTPTPAPDPQPAPSNPSPSEPSNPPPEDSTGGDTYIDYEDVFSDNFK